MTATHANQPLALIWAQRSAPPCPPPGGYDARTQRWSDRDVTGTGASVARAGALTPPQMQDEPAILIVTRRFDPHADAVIAALDARGVESFRLNSEDLLNAYRVSWASHDTDNTQLTIADQFGRSVSLPSGIFSGYYRTPLRTDSPAAVAAAEAQSLCASEGDAFLDCLYALPSIRWVPAPHLIRHAESKIPQLQLARRLGLRIPRTIVTNDPAEAHRFASSVAYDIVVKPLMTSTVESADGICDLYTHRLSRDEIEEHIEAIRFTPTLLQEYVPKSTEIRVTIIGSDIFATEIDSQSVQDAKIDWRQVDPFTVPHKPISLPESLKSLLRRFLDQYGLCFGAIDLIRTPEGDYVFLENNPNGQWYWLEVLTGQPMAASMARLLTSTNENA